MRSRFCCRCEWFFCGMVWVRTILFRGTKKKLMQIAGDRRRYRFEGNDLVCAECVLPLEGKKLPSSVVLDLCL